jgi:hypothetical protein
MTTVFFVVILASALLAFLAWQVRRRHLGRWLVPYIVQTPHRRPPRSDEEVHLLLCVADHFEPQYGNAGPETARARVQRWAEDYPRQFGRFRDSDGRTPRHTFFYPAEEYAPEYLDALTELCAAGFGEVEVHLHHDGDTPEGLRRKLLEFKDVLASRHGLLARRRQTGEPAYAFVHGNWALCNSRSDGRYCGVNNELAILRETGCFADLTLPSAPSDTQTPTINSLYYAVDIPGQSCSHAHGTPVGQGEPPADGLLLIQGPLLLDWRRRKWGVFPRLENGCLQKSQPPIIERLPLWLRARVQVPSRPDWFFVKLHCHGAEEISNDVLLGEPMVRFHEALAEEARRNTNFFYHYVTAREMYNLVKAAESGWTGTVAEALDHEMLPGSALAAAHDRVMRSCATVTCPPVATGGVE